MKSPTRSSTKLAIAVIVTCLALAGWRVEVNGQGQGEHGPGEHPTGGGHKKPGGSPDLMVHSISAPSSATRGSVIAVSDVITNKSVLYASGANQACLYLNTTPTITGASNLGTHSTAAIAPKGKTTWSGNVTIPASQPTGQNYYIVITDCMGGVPETDENNNTNSVPITIN